MLTHADEQLSRRDRYIHGLGLVLDAAAIQDRLTDVVPGLLDVHVRYVRYKPGTSIVASVALRTEHGPTYGLAAAYQADLAHPKLGKVRDVGPWAPVVDPGLGVVLAPAEADPKLPGVRAVTRHCSLAGDELDTVRPLRYNPARRWVGVGQRAGEPHRLVKVHRPDATPALVTGQRMVAAAGLPVPRLARCRSRLGLVTLSWVPGTSLDQLPAADQLAPLGQLLAQLHQADPQRVAVSGADVGVPSPRPAVRAVEQLMPELAAPVGAVVDACERHWHSRPAPASTLVHGDLSADQVIAGPDRLWLTDLDRVRFGDPAADLGNYGAAEVATGRAAPHQALTGTLIPLLEAYREAGGCVERDRVAVHAAAGLLHRVLEPFRFRQPDWPTRIGELVKAAETMLAVCQ